MVDTISEEEVDSEDDDDQPPSIPEVFPPISEISDESIDEIRRLIPVAIDAMLVVGRSTPSRRAKFKMSIESS